MKGTRGPWSRPPPQPPTDPHYKLEVSLYAPVPRQPAPEAVSPNLASGTGTLPLTV